MPTEEGRELMYSTGHIKNIRIVFLSGAGRCLRRRSLMLYDIYILSMECGLQKNQNCYPLISLIVITIQMDELTRQQRYYLLHRESLLTKQKEAYANRPDIKAKREERERKQAELEAIKQAKRDEKERIRQERIALAIATRAERERAERLKNS